MTHQYRISDEIEGFDGMGRPLRYFNIIRDGIAIAYSTSRREAAEWIRNKQASHQEAAK